MTYSEGGSFNRDYYSGRTVIAGTFPDRPRAEQAISALKGAGFRGEQIGVALRDRTAQGELVRETGSEATEGAVAGALGGGLLGAFVGFLVGVGALAIPGIGPIIAGGALATAFGVTGGATLAGAGIGAAAGGVVGALIGMGIPEEEARYFESRFRAGDVLVTVNTGAARALEAIEILREYGADIGPAGSGRSSLDDASPRGA